MKKSLLPMLTLLPLLLVAQVTQVNLSLTQVAGGAPLEVSAMDSGSGFMTSQSIDLMESTQYEVKINLGNVQSSLEARSSEIQFYFQDEPHFLTGSVQYLDSANQLPVGFTTQMIVDCVQEDLEGHLRLLLIDYGKNKTDASTADQGDTIFVISWPVTVTKDPNAPPCENEEEIITDVLLTWTPADGGTPIIARAQDPDGEGPLDLMILDDIRLYESIDYTLAITVANEVNGTDITEELLEEADEHLFLFAFSDELMQSPSGDGNADNRADPINYLDEDSQGLPLGLMTRWVTACVDELTTGTFRLILKHQPDIKSVTSDVNDGGTDLDLTFVVAIMDQADAPPCENEEEIITDVILTWISEGDTVVAQAQDPDGEGPLDLEILNDIELLENQQYTLNIQVLNAIEGEDLTDEIREESDEHMFFFGFSEGLFSDPAGDGNIDQRNDAINYLDYDGNNLPVGLITQWTTSATMSTGTFQLILKHQPQSKSASSTVEDGGTDIDLTFNVRQISTSSRDLYAPSTELLIMPNPVRSVINWQVKNDPSPSVQSISIVNLQGLTVYQTPYGDMRINMDQLPAGIYVIKLQTHDRIWSGKFFKE